ncbi:hypothetical protein [Haliea sp.]|uniref:hypothetical protein n=1 Tax=Haliea sp. TaxID=1932666 RepID=UPI0025BB4BEA|nr:hypothetical protein [Haliea sp.]|tara:strand:+ start:7963 stop:8676 length:714 start_codon:yes stop_codon:yes gene_type:complete
MATQRDLHKLACLEPLGLQLLVAHRTLPGAAPSPPRVSVQRGNPVLAPQYQPAELPERRVPPSPVIPAVAPPAASPRRPASAAVHSAARPVGAPAVTFSIVSTVAGGCLWLQAVDSGDLPTDELQLIRAMGFARGVRAGDRREGLSPPTRFDWPMHTNRQLDLGEEAAAAALTGFVLRQLRDRDCHGLVLLGERAGQYLLQPELDGVRTVRLPACAEMIAAPALKRDAWLALLALEH